MKKLYLLLAAILIASTTFAQQLHIKQFATLTHNDTVTGVWYGADALNSAYNSAVTGDVITLSPGSFNAVTRLNKAITIHGAGMQFDSIAETEPTYINNRFSIEVSSGVLKMEGLYCTADWVVYRTAYSPQFSKCRFVSIRKTSNGSVGGLNNPIFTNCIIGTWDGTSSAVNAMFINSVILNSLSGSGCMVHDYESETRYWACDTYYGSTSYGVSADVYYNCIIGIPPALTNNKRNIINCITYSTNTGQGTAANVYNTVGITDSTDFYAYRADHNNSNVHGFESIFKTFRGTYTAGETFELTPQAAATYLGSDSTQVGIYGGSTPYNPKATDMRIQKYAVGFYSDQNGQLQINVTLDTVSH